MQRIYCRSILLLWYRPSHSLWINLWTCMVSELSCHIWEATIVWTPALSVVYIWVCWPPKRRVYTITSPLLQHRKYLLLLCCLPYLPSQGVTLFERSEFLIDTSRKKSLRVCLCARVHACSTNIGFSVWYYVPHTYVPGISSLSAGYQDTYM